MLHIRNDIPTPVSEEDAHKLQTELSRELKLGEAFKYIAGVDVAYSKDDKRAYVAAVVLSTSNWRPISEQKAVLPVPYRYEAGMFSWREGPLAVEVLCRLPIVPDLILVDGNGIAHPRRFGLACYIGYALDHPTIGVAKTWPFGCLDTPATVPKERGSKRALIHEVSKEKLGYELYTQPNTNPVFVSPGHRVSVDQAASLVLRCAPNYRNPEPLRAADHAANEFRRNEGDV